MIWLVDLLFFRTRAVAFLVSISYFRYGMRPWGTAVLKVKVGGLVLDNRDSCLGNE